MIGVLFAVGLSFSTITFLNQNETINSLISSINGDKDDDDDSKDSYFITYIENTGKYKNGINLINQFPTEDETGMKFVGENYVFNFSIVIGKNTAGANYQLIAVPDTKNTFNGKYAKLYLEKDTQSSNQSFKNGKVRTFTEYPVYAGSKDGSRVIYSGKISEAEATKGKIDFAMRMWVASDTPVNNDFGNKSFAVKINTFASFNG